MCNAQVVSQPTPVVRLIAIDTEADGVLPALRLSAVYGPHEIQLPKLESSMRSSNEWDGGPRMQLVAAADGYLRVERNLEAEEALNRELRRLGLVSRFHEATGEPAWGPGADEVGAYIGAWQKLLPALEALGDNPVHEQRHHAGAQPGQEQGQDRVIVDFAMRYGTPAMADVLESMLARGVRKLLVLPQLAD